MATEPGPFPAPHTPTRDALMPAAVSEPLNSYSPLTATSSLNQTSGKSSSLLHLYPRSMNLTNNGNFPTSQKVPLSAMTPATDKSPFSSWEPQLKRTDFRPSQRSRQLEERGYLREMETWVPDSNGLNTEWPQEERDRLMHSLKEDGLLRCLHEYLNVRKYPATKLLRAFGKQISDDAAMTQEELLKKLQSVMRQALRNRSRIQNYTTVSDAVELLRGAQRILVLTGAGISVSCGVPDFRSADGIYSRIKASEQYRDLDDPQEMFSLEQFIRRPSMFYSFIGQLWPKDAQPSISHKFIRLLETKDKLLRNYTQNIDSMESVAGVQRVFHCHGSFATAKCMDCSVIVPGSTIHEEALGGRIPRCAPCVKLAEAAALLRPKLKAKPKKKKKKKKRSNPWDGGDSESDSPREASLAGVMKPSITFFGEDLCDSFSDLLCSDRDEVDLLLIIGTSLKVKPVSEILDHIPHSIPQILINKTPVEHANPDIVLLGDCDEIIDYLCDELEWAIPSAVEDHGQPRQKRELDDDIYPKRLGNSHIWLFEGGNIPVPYARRYDPSFIHSSRKAKRPRLN